MHAVIDRILQALIRPAIITDLPMSFWSDAMPRLRRSGVLGRLAAETKPLWPSLPEKIRDQFQAAVYVAEHQQRAIANELRHLGPLLAQVVAKPVLLKGAAYQALGLPNSRGRLASDIDVLVPYDALDAVEALLLANGWAHINRSEYDQHYYRTWMHELPPLRHNERGTFLDLHHAITPPVSRVAVRSELLFDAAVPVAGSPFYALAPTDLVLHSVCHLMSDGEFPHGLRDLYDIRELIQHYGRKSSAEGYWHALVDRVAVLGVERFLYYAADCLERRFEQAIPPQVKSRLDKARPPRILEGARRRLMDQVIVEPSVEPSGQRMARALMLARSHYLRMPMRLLVPHLARKTAMRMGVIGTPATG